MMNNQSKLWYGVLIFVMICILASKCNNPTDPSPNNRIVLPPTTVIGVNTEPGINTIPCHFTSDYQIMIGDSFALPLRSSLLVLPDSVKISFHSIPIDGRCWPRNFLLDTDTSFNRICDPILPNVVVLLKITNNRCKDTLIQAGAYIEQGTRGKGDICRYRGGDRGLNCHGYHDAGTFLGLNLKFQELLPKYDAIDTLYESATPIIFSNYENNHGSIAHSNAYSLFFHLADTNAYMLKIHYTK